jgi:diguanylate cyclase (GGDEF)-like protein
MATHLESTQEIPGREAAGRAPRRDAPGRSIEQEELRGISRTVAGIHWLLFALVLVYLVFGGVREDAEEAAAVSSGLFLYAALETVGMMVFITWVLWHTDRLGSPLLNAYLLAVVTSALTLGKVATLAHVAAVAGCYVFLGQTDVEEFATLRFVSGFAAQLGPVVLVAYITTMFSADLRYGLQRAQLPSETDDLTGLFNTRGFAIAANRLLGQALRSERPASLLMIDSDNLKGLTDAYGQDAGNRLLRQLARAIQAELRATDVPARYGGDEFIVLLPETPPKGALEVAERIRNVIGAAPLPLEGRMIECSVSVGLACFPEDGRSLDALAARADRALHQAKKKGRNCVVRYQQPL